jgi:hypothetical protein
MSSSTKPVHRTLAVLKLPEKHVPRFITLARSIVQAMTGNPSFPAPSPPLAAIQSAIDDLSEAESSTLARTVGTVASRDEKRNTLRALLQRVLAYVQIAADQSPEVAASIIEGAGMSVKKARVLPPRVFTAMQGRVSGEVKLIAPRAANRSGYEWAYSLDRGTTWVPVPFTVKASATVTGLEPGAQVLFRYRAVTKDVSGDWTDPVPFIVG